MICPSTIRLLSCTMWSAFATQLKTHCAAGLPDCAWHSSGSSHQVGYP